MESVYFPQRPLGLIGFIQTLGEEIRMKRICAVFLALVFFLTTLPAMAQNPASPRKVIPFNELASSSSLSSAELRAVLDDQSSAPSQPVKHRHLTTAGKVLTWIGVAFMGSGAAEMTYGFAGNPGETCNANGQGCVNNATIWKVGGAADAGAGVVLFLIGQTRRTTE